MEVNERLSDTFKLRLGLVNHSVAGSIVKKLSELFAKKPKDYNQWTMI